MGKSQPPRGNPAQGLAAYQKVLKQKDAAPEEAPASPSPEGAEDPLQTPFPEMMVFPELAKSLPPGFLKTGDSEDTGAEAKPKASKPAARPAFTPPAKTPPVKAASPSALFPSKGIPSATDKGVPITPAKEAAASGFVKVTPSGEAGGHPKDSKIRRVAKFLILIGGEEAAKVLSSLEPGQIEAVSKEIAGIRGITSEEAEAVFTEFRSLLSASYRYGGGSSGGVEAARQLLYAAFGPEKGESFLKRAVPQYRDNPFNFLADFSGEQTALLLREESPATAALILSRLPANQAAATLANLPPERKFDVVKRIARLGQTNGEILERVATALREKARHISDAGDSGAIPLDGRNTLAAILKHTDLDLGGRILEELEDEDPELSQDLKERLHTLEDVLRADDRPLQARLRDMDNRDIVLLLKGQSGEFADKILSNVSAGRRQQIREDEDLMGPVSKRDADQAVRNFLAWFRQNREEGRILLTDDEDVIV